MEKPDKAEKRKLYKQWWFITSAVAILILLALGGYALYYAQQPKFSDVSIELGVKEVPLSAFLTEYAKEEKAAFVTDMQTFDYMRTGDFPIELSYGGKRHETVTLSIRDTVAPVAEFQDILRYTDYVPEAKDFVLSVEDYSPVEISFVHEPVISGYSDQQVEILLKDASGNETRGQCTLSLTWMRDEFALELGTPITKEDILLNPQLDGELVSQELIDQINAYGIGEYEVVTACDGIERAMKLVVQDTTGPELTLRDVTIYIDEKTDKNAFIVSAEDISGKVDTTLKTELSFGKKGTQTVTIAAKDIYGNLTEKTAKLNIIEDTEGPEFTGLGTLSVKKHSSPDYQSGVRAIDAKEGEVSFSVSADAVDTSKAGTYYATYTAKDSRGNTTTKKRKVEVAHDAEDTQELIRQMAAQCGNDPQSIRNFVRSRIKYNSNWGGDDPVWYGFTNNKGNCYVHALCFQAILREKGISTQLIWVTDKSHYWNLVYVGGGWKHMDTTPSSLHGRYILMNDAQRLETLSGRVWDTSAWPACE